MRALTGSIAGALLGISLLCGCGKTTADRMPPGASDPKDKAAFAAPDSRSSGEKCSIAHVDRCRDSNELAFSRGFQPALDSFFGHRRDAFTGKRQSLADYASDRFYLPAGAPEVVGGNVAIAGGMPHNAPEGAMVVVQPGGKIIACGILVFPAHTTDDDPDRFYWRVKLRIYYRKAMEIDDAIEHISSWGRRTFTQKEQENSGRSDFRDKVKIELIDLADGAGAPAAKF